MSFSSDRSYIQTVDADGKSLPVFVPRQDTFEVLNVKDGDFGAKGDGETDDAAAINAAVAALPEEGGTVFFPQGVYLVKSGIEITKPSVRFSGVGWDQGTVTGGSVLKAGANMAALVKVTSTATTFKLDTMALNGGGNAESVLKLEALNCQIRDAGLRQPKTAGVIVDASGESVWLTNLRVNGANQGESTGIKLSGTDATVVGCKPVNLRDGIVMTSGASGAILSANHITPGGTIGRFCIYLSEAASNITITGNRIDNHKSGAGIQLSFSANCYAVNVTNNLFYQNTITNETYPAIAVDVSSGNCYGFTVVGNTVRSAASHLYSALIAGLKSGGEASTNRGRVKTMGTVCSGNTVYAKAMYGSEVEPLVGGSANTWSEAGTSWEAK